MKSEISRVNNLPKKSNQKVIQKYKKTQNVTQKTVKNLHIHKLISETQNSLAQQNLQNSSTKKTIISQRNIILKPFEEKNLLHEQQNESNLFGSLDEYLSDFQKVQQYVNQKASLQNIQDQFEMKEDSQMGEKFLSNILRKNTLELRSKQKNKLPLTKSQIKLQSGLKNPQYLLKNQNSYLNKNIFHNDKLSKKLLQRPNSISQAQKDKFQKRFNIEKPKIFRIKTQIHTIVDKSDQKQGFKKTEGDKSQRYSQILNDLSHYKFLPACNSPIKVHKNKKIQNSQQPIITNDVIHQCYQNLQSKSKKLLRYSLIRQPNLSLLENRSKKGKKMQKQLNSLKNIPLNEKNKFKLPLIANGHSLQDKKQVNQKSNLINSIYLYKKNPKFKQKINLTKNRSEIFKKYSNHLHTENIKDRLRCYSQLESTEQKVFTQNLKIKRSLQQTKNISPSNSINEIIINKSLSSKILQNFHQRYKNIDPEKSPNQKITNINLSQKFVSRCRDSIDWQHKKKFIIKKLGIII